MNIPSGWWYTYPSEKILVNGKDGKKKCSKPPTSHDITILVASITITFPLDSLDSSNY